MIFIPAFFFIAFPLLLSVSSLRRPSPSSQANGVNFIPNPKNIDVNNVQAILKQSALIESRQHLLNPHYFSFTEKIQQP